MTDPFEPNNPPMQPRQTVKARVARLEIEGVMRNAVDWLIMFAGQEQCSIDKLRGDLRFMVKLSGWKPCADTPDWAVALLGRKRGVDEKV